jgi:adsorption protein B
MRRKPFPWPSDAGLNSAAERRIAIFVPLWHEHRVVGKMLESNLKRLRYANYEVFAGVYPNDELTVQAVAEAAMRHPRVHMITCEHDGPTTKGDCLNRIYAAIADYEKKHDVRFDLIVTHDAEDVIHPDSLRLINWFSDRYEMVQVPVLPEPSRVREWTRSLYGDDFAEYQTKDIPVRQALGGFLPGNGVGTGFSRRALDRLAASRGGLLCDPSGLTEDYETGFALHALGYRQLFIPLRFGAADLAATRELFPKRFSRAVGQRSRWVQGIALQGWQQHGWRGPWKQVYWFWRDRKGLVGNLLSPAANLLFAYGLARWMVHRAGISAPGWMVPCYAATCGLAVSQIAVRCHCSARIYGWRFAAAAPFRMFWGNVVNCAATARAIGRFAIARLRRLPQAWQKTDHAYPRERLGEVLVRMNCVAMGELEDALCSVPKGRRIGEHLVQLRKISQEDLYQALSQQSGIPLGLPAAEEVDRVVTHALPVDTARQWKVLPYRVEVGQLHMVTADLPSERMTQELAAHSTLEFRFRLVRPQEFEELAAAYLTV